MILVIVTACAACFAIGAYLGHVLTLDHREHAGYQAAYPAGSHARSEPLRLSPIAIAADTAPATRAKGVTPSTAELFALLERDASVVTYETPPTSARGFVQPPLRELVQPGRTTDFIEQLEANTDRWIAANIP